MTNEHNYKLLDCNRKAILGLPSGAVHLWLVYYMHESEAQESYLSLSRLELITGWDRKTVIKWRDYLKENGWLIETGDHASDRYAKPTQGSHRVPVVRVDDPNKGSGIIQLEEKSGSGEFLGGKIPPKVSSSLSGSASGSASNSPQLGVCAFSARLGSESKLAETAALLGEKIKAEPRPQTKIKKQYVAKDGTPYPEDFFTNTVAWPDNNARTKWLCAHDPDYKPIRTMEEVETEDFLREMEEEPEQYVVPQFRTPARPRGEKPTRKPKPELLSGWRWVTSMDFPDLHGRHALPYCESDLWECSDVCLLSPDGKPYCLSCYEAQHGSNAKGA